MKSVAFSVCLLAALSAPCASARPAGPNNDPAFQQAVAQYREGRLAAAYGRFVRLANQGDPDAARIALFMHRYGPVLFGNYWDAQVEEIEMWTELSSGPQGRPQPPYRPERSVAPAATRRPG